MEGVIKFYDRLKLFGFISANEHDYFFRDVDLMSPVIAKGDRVAFEVISNRKGLRATAIEKIVPKRTFFNAGPVSSVQSNTVKSDPGTAQYFSGCIEREIDGTVYTLIPLAEVCRHYELKETDFLSDVGLDVICQLQKLHNYKILLSL